MASLAVTGCIRETPSDPPDTIDECPNNPNKNHRGVCGCDTEDVVDALTGIYTCLSINIDLCPNDPYKTKPGVCGCGVADTIGKDGIALCLTQNFDLCPDDPKKTLPGICGCGVEDTIDSATGLASCIAGQLDLCPEDDTKTLPGVCGCGVPDTPDEETGIPLCTVENLDFCPSDPDKIKPGICGCGVPDNDSDQDGKFDCEETCIHNALKYEPGICGCDVLDNTQNLADNDKDLVPNCLDFCPNNYWKQEDDGCSCEELHYENQGVSGCAQIIETATDFIAFRNKWNKNEFRDSTNDMAFILVKDINLGEVLTQNTATKWEGVGTELYPFNAIFLGNHHVIEGIRHSGTMHQNLVFGSGTADDVALFNYTSQARIFDLKLDLNIEAKHYGAGLIAHAVGTVINDIEMKGTINAMDYAGGIIAEASVTTLNNIISDASVTADGDYSGGILGVMSESQINNVESKGTVIGQKYTGGIVGSASKGSRLINVYANGSISGKAYTGAVAGEITSRSSILNTYTTSQLTCYESPCALLVAQIGDFVTVKNGYTTGMIINEIQGSSSNPTHNPSPKDGDGDEEPTDISIPIASLIASFTSADNIVEQLYYWKLQELPTMPDEAMDMSMVEIPTPFSYVNLNAYTDATGDTPSVLLIDKLNGALSCNLGVCTLDGYTCIQWTNENRSITLPDNSGNTISVHLPVLHIKE